MNRIYLIITLTVLFFGGVFAQEFNTTYTSFKSGEKWGFKSNGEIVIPASFDYVTEFSENLSLVKSDGKWGYIDLKGDWFMKPQFSKAQPFVGGIALVVQENKVGLLSKDKSFLIRPEYENVQSEEDYYIVVQENKRGFIIPYKESFRVIPAKYTAYDKRSEFLSAQKPDRKWDIYYEGLLVLEDVERAVSYDDYTYQMNIFKYVKNGKFGAYSFDGKMIAEPNYAKIEFLNFTSYDLNDGTKSDKLIGLHTLAFNSDEELDDWLSTSDGSTKNELTILKADGSKFTDLKFEYLSELYDVYAETQKPYVMQAKLNDEVYNIDKNFNIEKLAYSNLISHYYGNYFIAQGKEKQFILDKNSKEIASFHRIDQHSEIDFNDGGDYIDEWTGEFIGYRSKIVQEPFLLVYRLNENQEEERAVYCLDERKIISNWDKELNYTLTVKRLSLNNSVLYVFETTNHASFYVKGMNSCSEMKYLPEAANVSNGHFYINFMVGDDEVKTDLFDFKNGMLNFISDKFSVHNSSSITTESFYFDEETGEDVFTSKGAFDIEFTYLKDENNKFGLIAQNGKLIFPKYDTIVPRNDETTLIDIHLGSLVGSIDFENGNIIEPFSIYTYTFEDSYEVNFEKIYYFSAYIDSLDKDMYINSKGDFFECLPNRVFGKKVKKAVVLSGYPRYKMEPIQISQEKYRNIEPYFLDGYFKVQGKNKKWGLIDYQGKIVLPIEFTGFSMENYFQEDFYSVTTFQGKKKGLYRLNEGVIIPCIYDDIRINYLSSNVIEVTQGKKVGLVDKKGKVLLPCDYDELESIYYLDNEYFVASRTGGKKIFFTDFKENNLPEFNFILEGQGFVKKEKSFEIYNIDSGEKTVIENNDGTILKGENYNIFIKNGKFGASDLNGKELVPAEYEFATFFDSRNEVMIGIQNGVKYYIYVENNDRYTEGQW